MLKYTLTYFNSNGRVEPVRWIFKFKNIEFTDKRMQYGPEWNGAKDSFPWVVLPYLEIEDEDGNKKGLSQSVAIARYLAKEFDLAGQNAFESAKCDEYADTIIDLGSAWGTYFYVPSTPEAKEASKTKMTTETFPRALKRFEEDVKKNGGKFIVGGGLTWADFMVAHYFQNLFVENFDEKLLDDYPVFKAYVKGIYEIPQIKKWVAERPVVQL